MLLAIDCDLHRIHGRVRSNNTLKTVASGVKTPEAFGVCLAPYLLPSLTILFEVASAVDYGQTGADSKRRWMLYNIAVAASLATALPPEVPLLVAPSSKWTKGLARPVRHALCKTVAPTKDLRECDAMMFMYDHEPQSWVPFNQYLADL